MASGALSMEQKWPLLRELNAVNERDLSKKFEMKDLGPLHHFLGVKVIQDQLTGVIWIGQSSYTEKFLQKFGMYDCKS